MSAFRVIGASLESFPGGEEVVTVIHLGCDPIEVYRGESRAEAHRHYGEAMLKMRTWQPHRSDILAHLAAIPASTIPLNNNHEDDCA